MIRKSTPALRVSFFSCSKLIRQKADQRHHLPRHQEEERVRRGEDQRQAQQQQVEEEPKSAQVPAPFHLPQVSEGIERNGCCQRR
jgi:hypothetical protein